MIGRYRALKKAGVLGINRRNAFYTLIYNERARYPDVDDKIRTKQLALKAGLAVPDLYGVVESHGHISKLHDIVSQHREFVVKPSRGSGGKGILVLEKTFHDLHHMPNGDFLTNDDLKHHVNDILSGVYSLGGQPDAAMIEYRVEIDPVFRGIAHRGVPDIRIIVFLGVPIMAMLRLPTQQSKGRANLHQGAIGAGIDVATGRTLAAVWRSKIIDEHPDTANPLTGVQIPHWEHLLELAAGCHELTGMGYLGIDFVLDKNLGPLMLEINARPGLDIQIANQTGLEGRFEQVKGHRDSLGSLEDRVNFARIRFQVAQPTP